jgi:outer membrane cobalamin receptor
MFKGTSFSTGGYSSEYGQALSSALVLDSKDKSELTRTDIGILSVGGDVGHTQVWEKGSIAGKVQYTNIRPYVGLIRQEIDWKNAPASMEGSAAFRHNVGKTGLLKFYGNFNDSEFSLYRHDIDDASKTQLYELENKYRYLNAFYKGDLSKNWAFRGGISYTYLQNKTQIENDQIDDLQKGLHLKAVIEGSLTDNIELKAGTEIIDRNYDKHFQPEDQRSDSFHEVITASFVEGEMYATEKFVVRTGLRGECNSLIQQFRLDPRISLAYKTGNHAQVSLAYGRFRQTAKNEFVFINNDLSQEKAIHYILNYQYVKDGRTFRVETYYKKYSDLVKYVNGDAADLNSDGHGEAKGIELFWRDNKSISHLDYWISYSYLDTKRDYLNFPYAVSPSFASPHNFSVVTKYFFRKVKSQVGMTYSFTSGRPYNNPNNERYNNGRTPNYSDLSLNLSYLPSPSIIVHFSCTNILGRDNVFGYEFSDTPTAEGFYNGRAIRQAAPRFLFLGIFITLSKDKSVNQLPNL